MKYTLCKLFYSSLILFPASCLLADWVKVVDFEDYDLTTDEAALIDKGWIFQDWDFVGFPECVDGTLDCTGVREVVQAPYGDGNGKAMLIRAGDPAEVGAANARSITAYDLPEEIPVDEVGTFYMRIAFERPEVAPHWGLTQFTEPVTGPDEPHNNYGDLGPSTSSDFFGTQQVRVHSGGWITASEDTSLVWDVEEWYEIWYLIQNNSAANGSGVYDLYIRGGVMEEITHFPNYTLPQDLIDAGVTVWQFRNRVDEPIRRWLNVQNLGAEGANLNYYGTGAIFIDDFYVNVGELTTETPDTTTNGDTWAGFEVLDGGDCDTGSLLGWVNVLHAPFIFSYSLNQWMYIEESAVSGDGTWAYVFNF